MLDVIPLLKNKIFPGDIKTHEHKPVSLVSKKIPSFLFFSAEAAASWGVVKQVSKSKTVLFVSSLIME